MGAALSMARAMLAATSGSCPGWGLPASSHSLEFENTKTIRLISYRFLVKLNTLLEQFIL